eukprot:TRINITY_DN40927_c0_g1_i2.p1 TRINITY_DN40927_c0_g1~~TRINITY_DN40927_c0_g1_i2.p1  ORF type:complete len:701 (+),score=102.31 TRINITY_DN40927_c0_g1_i2:142-2244(+)
MEITITLVALAAVVVTWICIAVATDIKELMEGLRVCAKHLQTWFNKPDATDDRVVELRWRFVVDLNNRFMVILLIASFVAVPRHLLVRDNALMPPEQLGVFASAFAAVVLFRVAVLRLPGMQSRLGMLWLDLSYLYFTMGLVFTCLFIVSSSLEAMFGSYIVGSAIRMFISMLPLDKRFVFGANALYDAAVVWKLRVSSTVGECTSLPGGELMHIFVSVLFLNSPLFAGSVFSAEIKADNKADIMSTAARGLMDHVCDAVLDLDLDFRIMTEAPRLSALLLKAGSHSLKGSRLTDWMPEASVQRLCELQRAEGGGGCSKSDVGVLNIALRDLTSNLLPVEAFYMRIASEARYLLGVRKGRQQEVSPPPGAPPEVVQAPREVLEPIAVQPLQPLQPFQPLQPMDMSHLSAARSVKSMDSCSSSGCSDYSRSTRRSRGAGRSVASTRSGGPKMVVPGRVSTTLDTKHVMVNELLRRVNFERSSSQLSTSCCKRHDAVNELLKFVVRLKNGVCSEKFSHHTAWQCHACGVLRNKALGDAQDCRTCFLRETAATLASQDRLSTSTDSSNGNSRVTSGLAIPDKRVTAIQARQTLLEEVLSGWNVGRLKRGRRCCQWHGALEHLFQIIAPLQQEVCEPTFDYYIGWQCTACGILDFAAPRDRNCSICQQLDFGARPHHALEFSSGAISQPAVAAQTPGDDITFEL